MVTEIATPPESGAVEQLRCTWHPDRETLLRCNRCGRPMCTSCAVRHPVGLRCKECVRELRSPLYKVRGRGYVAAAAVALAAGTAVAWFVGIIGGMPFIWLLALLVGTAVGTTVGELVSLAAGRKRGRPLAILAAGGMIAGVAVAGALQRGGLSGALSLYVSPAVLVYLLVGVSAAMARLR